MIANRIPKMARYNVLNKYRQTIRTETIMDKKRLDMLTNDFLEIPLGYNENYGIYVTRVEYSNGDIEE